jgi:hypothetical protein
MRRRPRLVAGLQDDKCAITKKDFFKSAGGCKNVFVARSKDRRGRLTSIWQLIGAGGDTRNKGLCGRRGRKYFGDATHPKDKDAQKLPPKMLAAGFVATSGVKRTAGGHRFWRETGTRPIVRLTSGARGHGNDGFDVRFWLLQCKGLL